MTNRSPHYRNGGEACSPSARDAPVALTSGCPFDDGAKVVCVHAKTFDGRPTPLSKGKVYVVASSFMGRDGRSVLDGSNSSGRPAVMLAGLQSDTRTGGFDARRFRLANKDPQS